MQKPSARSGRAWRQCSHRAGPSAWATVLVQEAGLNRTGGRGGTAAGGEASKGRGWGSGAGGCAWRGGRGGRRGGGSSRARRRPRCSTRAGTPPQTPDQRAPRGCEHPAGRRLMQRPMQPLGGSPWAGSRDAVRTVRPPVIHRRRDRPAYPSRISESHIRVAYPSRNASGSARGRGAGPHQGALHVVRHWQPRDPGHVAVALPRVGHVCAGERRAATRSQSAPAGSTAAERAGGGGAVAQV